MIPYPAVFAEQTALRTSSKTAINRKKVTEAEHSFL